MTLPRSDSRREGRGGPFLLLLVLFAVACTETQVPAPLRSLQRSGRVSFVCRGADGSGRELVRCPDFERTGNTLFALVTQTVSGEVAVIDLADQRVVDVDPSTPGLSFLRVGAQPGAIVTSPGGEASFVGVGEVGKEGLFALPTSCLRAPGETEGGTREPALDLTSWPACALPSAPGELSVVVDPPAAGGGVRPACGAEPLDEAPPSVAAEREFCPADLRDEAGPPGRRKLLVSMPERGEIWTLDAQSLLDRPLGSFERCVPEAVHPLETSLPVAPVTQSLPPDLSLPGCVPSTVEHAPPPNVFETRPAGFALSEDVLYVADQRAPVIHVLDVSDPCAISERLPLLPVSLDAPQRVVTTSKLAVSPPTSTGERFLYAIDEQYQPSASVMIFDVSPGATQRTPLVRPDSGLVPFEPADRIGFSAAARDVAFVQTNLEISDELGRTTSGTRCDPDPDLDPTSPEARHRTTSDFEQGAGPRTLRGSFGLVLLTSGRVAIIDVDDLDAACRRPIRANPFDELDFQGCSGDPEGIDFFTRDGTAEGRPTVSAEVSCRSVLPHRARSGFFVSTRTEVGVHAPSLRAFPTLSARGRGQPADQSPEGKKRPKLLAVPFQDPAGDDAGIRPVVLVGTTPFRAGGAENELVIDPNEAVLGSVALPYVEPRAYVPQEEVTVAYEGTLGATRPSGFLDFDSEAKLLRDGDAGFCSRGVHDVALTEQFGEERFGLSGEALERFSMQHADYVQITAELVDEEDVYWSQGRGAACGGEGYAACEDLFGPADIDELAPARELGVVEAYQDRLVVEPRGSLSASRRADRLEMIDCCFPSGTAYVVRASGHWVVRGSASGFRHRVVPGAEGRCALDCNPRKRFFEGRVFEIATDNCPDADGDGEPDCSVGDGTDDDLVCVYDATSGAVTSGGRASECIFNTLTARFAVYRGREPSRGMVFSYQVLGGFATLAFNLTQETNRVLPQQLSVLPAVRQIAVVDSQDLGLSMLSLDSFDFSAGSPFF